MDSEKLTCKVYCLKCKCSELKEIKDIPKLSSNNRHYLKFTCHHCGKKVTRFVSKDLAEKIESKLEEEIKQVEQIAHDLAEEVLKE